MIAVAVVGSVWTRIWDSDPLFGILLGGAIALATSILAILGFFVQGRITSSLDRKRHARELRRDVVLEAVEDISKALAAVGGMANPSLPLAQLQDQADALAAAGPNKLLLIGSDGTVEQLQKCGWTIQRKVLELFEMRVRLDLKKERVEELEIDLDSTERLLASERQSLVHLHLMAQDHAGTDAGVQAAQREVEVIQRLVLLEGRKQNLETSLVDARSEVLRNTSAFVREALEKVIESSLTLFDLVPPLRSELDLPLADADKLKETVNRQRDELRERLDGIVNLIEGEADD